MSDNFVSVGKIATFVPDGPPQDITSIVQAAAPGASPRMITRFSDLADGSPALATVSSVCTHRGCPILTGDGVWGTADTPIYDAATRVITCPCHNSRFDVSSGAVVRGPAKLPLAVFETVIRDGEVHVSVSDAPREEAFPAAAVSPLDNRRGFAPLDSGSFPGAGNTYLVDFGAFVVELYFSSDRQLTYTGLRRDGSRGASETVEIEVTFLRDNLFMVTWQEDDRTTVVHIEDFTQNIIYTNITNPDLSFSHYRGSFSKLP